MIALYTYFPIQGKESCGFLNQNDLAYFLTLSVEYSKKHFKKVKLVTNKAGKEILIKKYKVGFTEVSTELEDLRFPPELWAYPKIVSMSLQKKSFCHIDMDCVFWERLPKEILKYPLFFQNKELFMTERGYIPLIKAIEKTTISYFCRYLKLNYAYNCGTIGCNYLDPIKAWKQIIDEFIFSPHNIGFWQEQSNKEQFNYILEQYFIACIIRNHGIENKIEFLLNSKDNIAKPQFKITHLWGKTKQSPDIEKIKLRLKKEFPEKWEHINSFDNNEIQVFDKLFEKCTEKQRAYLNKVIKEKKVKSIIYLKYGEYYSKYADLDGKIIDFLYSEETKDIIPQCDLLITGELLKW